MLRVNFSDRHKHVKNNNAPLLKLHGHTVIELHNHKSGSRERIEHDNTFTDGIANYLLSSGQFNNSPWANSTWLSQSLAQNLVGGIFLFDSAIPDNNGVYPTIMPAGTKMIANGSYGVSNNGAATEMGSFNTQESSFTDSACTFVYDWSTSQGNTGNSGIACVCLTSDIGGYIGYGNSVSNASADTLKALTANQSSNSVRIVDTRKDVCCIVGEYLYNTPMAERNGTTITVYRRRIALDSITLFRANTETITLTLPNELQNVDTYTTMADGLIVVAPEQVAVNASAKLGIYNISTGTWSTVSFTNTTDSGIYFQSYFYSCKHGAFSNKNFIKFSDGTITTLNISGDMNSCYEMADNLIYLSLTSGNYIYDIVNGTVYKTNGSVLSGVGVSSVGNNRFLFSDYYNTISSKYSFTQMFRNPLYLATVNNLDNVLTKTSSETMKVTYTITREE